MKKLLVAGIAAAAFCGAPALAADLPVKAPAYKAVAPMFNWTGFYVGAQAGYQWHHVGFGDPIPIIPNLGTYNANGFIGGVHAGYNYQVGNVVAGIEGDIEWADASGRGIGTGTDTVIGTGELKWQGSARGRLGLVFDRTLLYVTAGAAWGRFNFGFGFPVIAPVFDNFSTTLTGWTGGGGIEHAFAKNWRARIEYRYTDYGTAKGSIVNCCAGPPNHQAHDVIAHAVRGGISYAF